MGFNQADKLWQSKGNHKKTKQQQQQKNPQEDNLQNGEKSFKRCS